MKNRLLSIFILIATFGFVCQVSAQGVKTYRLEHVETESPAPYLLPTTTIKVKVVAEKETVKTGPYARFAQKYLGSIAPLTDKVTYTIKGATIGYVDDEALFDSEEFEQSREREFLSHVDNPDDFSKSQPDRVSLADRSLENAARDAASMIFTLRKRRVELITGEAGENVFGEGLEAAIKELHRVENEYLSLFYGKQITETITKVYDVVPKRGTTNYVALRFSPAEGLMSAEDLTGSPIVLTVAPEQAMAAGGRNTGNRYAFYQVAAWTQCKLVDGSNELAAARVPVYQFGTTVSVRVN